MSALTFEKSELSNLEYSLQREMLATDRICGIIKNKKAEDKNRLLHTKYLVPVSDTDQRSHV